MDNEDVDRAQQAACLHLTSQVALPAHLVARLHQRAADEHTNTTAIIRETLWAALEPGRDAYQADPLLAYSRGRLPLSDTLERLHLRDKASLLVMLGDVDLPMPTPPECDVQQQADTFADLMRSKTADE